MTKQLTEQFLWETAAASDQIRNRCREIAAVWKKHPAPDDAWFRRYAHFEDWCIEDHITGLHVTLTMEAMTEGSTDTAEFSVPIDVFINGQEAQLEVLFAERVEQAIQEAARQQEEREANARRFRMEELVAEAKRLGMTLTPAQGPSTQPSSTVEGGSTIVREMPT